MLPRVFYVILVVTCIIKIQADESTKHRSVHDLVHDAIQKIMTRKSNKIEDKLHVMNNDKHASKLWKIYKEYYSLTYSTPEEDKERSKKFIKNLKFITQQNNPLQRKVKSYKLGLNEFSSMDLKEVIQRYSGALPAEHSDTTENAAHFFDGHNLTASTRKTLPNSLDYRQHMNPIEHQGQCNSCYAFASLATVEGTYKSKKQVKINLSKQEVIDCVSVNRCQPWYIDRTLNYIKQHHGLQRAQSYPYHGVQQTCHVAIQWQPTGTIKNYVRIKPNDENAMKLALNTFGPLTALFTITKEFYHHTSGILNIPSCSKKTNHAVVIVGYGTELGKDYWLVRNSWGTTWGEKGYFKLARNADGMCGIANEVYYVTV